MSYSLLVDAHLINRDPKAALSVIKEMVISSFCNPWARIQFPLYMFLLPLQRSLYLYNIFGQVNSGFEPSKETLKKVKRRCMRETDYESDDLVEDFAKRFNLRMDGEARRNRLFELNYSTGYA